MINIKFIFSGFVIEISDQVISLSNVENLDGKSIISSKFNSLDLSYNSQKSNVDLF